MNKRLLKVKEKLVKERLDAILVSSVSNITYLTGYAGFSKEEREAFLLITADNQYILTDGRYSEAVRNSVANFELIEVSPISPFTNQLQKLVKKHKVKKMGFERNNLTVAELEKIKRVTRAGGHHAGAPALLGEWETRGAGERQDPLIVERLRIVKEPEEIAAIEKACELGDKTFEHVLKKIRQDITEKEVALEIEFFIKKAGGDISFPPIVAFGKNSSIPHHQTTMNSKLTTHSTIILLDFGVKLDNYCSDMTRTVFFGKPTNEQKRMYQTVLTAQQKAIEYLGRLTSDGGRLKGFKTPRGWPNGLPRGGGIKARDVDKAARSYILDHKYPTIPHSLGHGIGLEVHETPHLSPRSKDALKPGMVFSIEPGIYLPRRSPEQNRRGEGGSGEFGVRIEDLVVLEPAGPRLLTHSPKKIIEV